MTDVTTNDQPIILDEPGPLVADYLAAWNSPDPTTRRDLIGRHWAGDCRYHNPRRHFDGHDGVAEAMAATFDHWGATGHTFHLREPVGFRGRTVLVPWVMSRDGMPVSIGTSVWQLTPEGRIVLDVQFPGS